MKQLKRIVLYTVMLSAICLFSACGNKAESDGDTEMKTEEAGVSPSPEREEKTTEDVRSTEDAGHKATDDTDADEDKNNTVGDVVDDIGDGVNAGVSGVVDGVDNAVNDVTDDANGTESHVNSVTDPSSAPAESANP